jgi:hypothetical protein
MSFFYITDVKPIPPPPTASEPPPPHTDQTLTDTPTIHLHLYRTGIGRDGLRFIWYNRSSWITMQNILYRTDPARPASPVEPVQLNLREICGTVPSPRGGFPAIDLWFSSRRCVWGTQLHTHWATAREGGGGYINNTDDKKATSSCGETPMAGNRTQQLSATFSIELYLLFT